ncbi:septum formation initiator [Actinomadura craniellae]|uniref:Septum formation initiator n=1 Tax=Actinomadura craniellae TaxID=2231787 RepID=A0A365H5Z0_9ACTN|nr:AAA family ATPase [Actinomadura craniellae]RAY14412.1 septum formation initiator [Actinomadura craniellae]
MSIKVLIGTGDQEIAGALRASLAELADFEVIGVERTSADVLAIVTSENDLDVVLIDEEIGPQPAPDLARDIAMRRPHGAVVLLSGRVDEEALTRALEAGARGVVARRPSLEELQSRITAAAEWSRGMRRWIGSGPAEPLGGRRGKVIAFAGAKGGTGATTLAVQMALAASTARRTVCLVDMDLQSGDIPSYLDMVHRRSIVDLAGVAHEITGPMLADALFVHQDGPHVLLAPAEGERAEDVSSIATRQILGALRSRYDVVIVDCGSFMTEGSVSAIEIADRVVLTVTPDLPCLRAAKRMVHLWGRLQIRKDDEITPVLTKLNRSSEIQPDFAARILGLTPAKATIPPSFKALERAINNGTLSKVDDDKFRKAVIQLGTELGAVSPTGDGSSIQTKAEAR